MIVVVTLNPALDVTHYVDRADWSGVNRPHEVHVRAGGKGLNVARTLRTLGQPVRLAGLVTFGVLLAVSLMLPVPTKERDDEPGRSQPDRRGHLRLPAA